MSSYFPMSGFRATVCASTGDNRHNCARTTWGTGSPINAGKFYGMQSTLHTKYIPQRAVKQFCVTLVRLRSRFCRQGGLLVAYCMMPASVTTVSSRFRVTSDGIAATNNNVTCSLIKSLFSKSHMTFPVQMSYIFK